jgi:pimeloyl-ACP methyl ester carboxylesterase
MNAAPADCFFQSQGLRLHYADWGNRAAPPLILIHGGRDHCRSWDDLAHALQPDFHVIAPDLRGHGDSEWAKGSSYSLSDYVYDLARLMRAASLEQASIAGHSMGGMIAMVFAGTFPQRVTRLAILDGVTVLPDGAAPRPIHEKIARWTEQLDKFAEARPRSLDSIVEAAERMSAHNKRLTAEQAMHLARYAVRANPDGGYSWKFDEYQAARAPYRLSLDDYIALWSRITCPTLLLHGNESFLPSPEGPVRHFARARAVTISGAGHWLHHDKLDEVVALLREFLISPS